MAQEKCSKNSRQRGILRRKIGKSHYKIAWLRKKYGVPSHIPDEQAEVWVERKTVYKEAMGVLEESSVKYLRTTYKVPQHIPREQVRMWILEKWKNYL